MDFLLQSVDFSMSIQASALSGITGGSAGMTAALLEEAEALAMEEMKSYLVQRFDVCRAFAPMAPWNPQTIYQAFARVYLDAPAYNSGTSYAPNMLALEAGNVYICTESTTGTFDPDSWTALGPQYTMFFAQTPYPEFDYVTQYAVDDEVFWHNYTYVCLIQSKIFSQEGLIQYESYESLPPGNVDPENVNQGFIFWGSKTAYSIAVGTLPTNVTYWTQGDGRSAQLVKFMVDIILYHLHQRIAPENVPALREVRYKRALNWLKESKNGEETPNLPLLKPAQGMRVRYGGNIKNDNSY